VNVNVQPVSGNSRSAPIRANTDDSENKLLQTAELNLPTEGDWTLRLAVQQNADHADYSLPVHVVKAESGIGNPWPYLTLLAFSALLLATYLLRHGRTRAAGYRQPHAEATHAGSSVDLS
jgi:hypothetical protein